MGKPVSLFVFMSRSMQILRFVKAKTPKGLERAMLQNNMARKAWHQYQVVFDGKEWFAWYYVDLSGTYNQEIKELDGTQAIGN